MECKIIKRRPDDMSPAFKEKARALSSGYVYAEVFPMDASGNYPDEWRFNVLFSPSQGLGFTEISSLITGGFSATSLRDLADKESYRFSGN